jgi:hypothetical protein
MGWISLILLGSLVTAVIAGALFLRQLSRYGVND